jgi:acyl-coenzyme A thioesterase PaaI-like protein
MSISNKPLRAGHFIKHMLTEEAGCFDSVALQGLQVVNTEPGRVVCRLHITKRACNRYGTLHGGCIGGLYR